MASGGVWTLITGGLFHNHSQISLQYSAARERVSRIRIFCSPEKRRESISAWPGWLGRRF